MLEAITDLLRFDLNMNGFICKPHKKIIAIFCNYNLRNVFSLN